MSETENPEKLGEKRLLNREFEKVLDNQKHENHQMSEDVLKVGIVGTGFGSVVQFPSFKHNQNFDPVAIVGKHKTKTEKIATKIGASKSYTDWKLLIEDKDIDVISIVTPPNLHKEMAIAAFDAGKHVLCEKPLSMNTNEAKEMVEAAEDSGLVAMVNLEFRYIPSKAYFAELINMGYLGEIFQFDITVRNPSRLNPRIRGYNWWSDKNAGGGILFALGSHYIDYMNLLFGEVNRVCGQTVTHIPKRLNKLTGKMQKVSADDAFTCLFDVGDGILSSMKISTTTAFGRGARIEAYGSEGTLILTENDKIYGAKVGDEGNLKHLPIPANHQLEKLNGDHYLVPPLTSLLNDFASGVKRGSSPHPNFEDGLKVQQILDGIKESNRRNRWISIDY